MEKTIKRLAVRLERLEPGTLSIDTPRPGWALVDFETAQDAACFFTSHPQAAMPCWRRMEVVDGQLVQVR